MAAGLEPPSRVFAHGCWTHEGEKISKSLGNVIDPYEIVTKYGLDQIRVFLVREVPFGNDGDFSNESILQRVNADLSNNFGNLIQRLCSFINKNCESTVINSYKKNDLDKKLFQISQRTDLQVSTCILFGGRFRNFTKRFYPVGNWKCNPCVVYIGFYRC